MKHIFYTIGALALLMLAGACDNMLRTTSDRFVKSEDNLLDSPNDSLYSVAGILSKMQKVGDVYVVLGDLRADLMDVTHNADQELRDISSLNISADNKWVDPTPFYDIINHCNFVISRMDTSIYMSGKKVLMPDFAAAKAVRAWSYMQLALNYGKAYYFTEPILNISDLDKSFELLDRDALFNLLVKDILPYVDVPSPSYGTIYNYAPARLIPDIRYLIGEMYLWLNNYQAAADMYAADIDARNMVVDPSYQSMWQKSDYDYSLTEPDFPKYYTLVQNWQQTFKAIIPQGDYMTLIPYYYTNAFGEFNTYEMYALTWSQYKVAPSQRARDLFENQEYKDFSIHDDVSYDLTWTGDLRGRHGAYDLVTSDMGDVTEENIAVYSEPEGTPYINMYQTLNQVAIQRHTLAYLRYAEAVNRMGKPSLAMAVINSGLNRELFTTWAELSLSEVTVQDSITWSYPKFDYNMGTRQRGQGNSRFITFDEAKPACETLTDSIEYVEKLLIEECGLETAFHGNRFHDLMRYSHHNSNNSIIAENIAEKHLDDYARYYAMMLDEQNWYLPFE